MLIVWGYLLLAVVAGIILIICGSFLLRLLSIGICLFIVAEIVTTALAIFGYMDYCTGWAISKWAFFIGGGIGVIQFLRSPSSFLRDAADIVSSIGNSTIKSDNSQEEKDDKEYDFPCCGNCKWNYDRGSYSVRCFQDGNRNKTSNEKCGQWQHC